MFTPGIDFLVALATFALVTSITPGPNNMMMTSGLNHGARASMPHFLGINFGFAFMIAVLGLGMATVFRQYPMIHEVIRYGGSVYMLFLAWKIANAGNPEAGESLAAPLTFFQAVAFQWVNPKAWVIAVSAIGMFTSVDNFLAAITLLIGVYFLLGSASMAAWLFLGVALQKLVNSERQLRIFNIAMAVLLVLSVLSLFGPISSG